MGLLDIFRISRIKRENADLKQAVDNLQSKLNSLKYTEYTEAQRELDYINEQIEERRYVEQQQEKRIDSLNAEIGKKERQLATNVRKIDRSKEIYNAISYSIESFHAPELNKSKIVLIPKDMKDDMDDLTPAVSLKLHCMDVKSLRKAYRENDQQIDKILELYASRYTLKSNRAIYRLMVIALRAELQNIIYNLKYEKLEEAEAQVKKMTAKYLEIAGDGNQSVAKTLTKFIGEIEYLFLNAVKIEYNYYVKKEQARQEQQAIREQMRQEAAERKALEQERKRVEKEEQKYKQEIDRITAQLQSAADSEIEKLKSQILSLQSSLSDVVLKKDEITSLQNGKAGNVYIISNLGSFGENVFKIGMTRRLDPQDRIDELGSASVPFKFDVHSFIFSEDAVDLENKLHERLNKSRVNKVNLRKEFFYSSIDELEQIVNEIDPTAEFTRTMAAEEFRESQSSDENYDTSYTPSSDDEDEDDE